LVEELEFLNDLSGPSCVQPVSVVGNESLRKALFLVVKKRAVP
jgi:hypothetical protein